MSMSIFSSSRLPLALLTGGTQEQPAKEKGDLQNPGPHSAPLSMGDTFQDTQWMSEMASSTKLYLLFFPVHTYQ